MQQKQTLELREFMEASNAKGISDEFLVAILVKGGWPEDVILGALSDRDSVAGANGPIGGIAEPGFTVLFFLQVQQPNSTGSIWARHTGRCKP